MSILEILEAHSFGHSLLTVRGFCNGCDWNSYTGPKVAVEEHRAHVAQVLEQHEQEAKAEAYEHAADRLLEEADFQQDLYRRNGRNNFIHAAVRMTVLEHEMRRNAAILREEVKTE